MTWGQEVVDGGLAQDTARGGRGGVHMRGCKKETAVWKDASMKNVVNMFLDFWKMNVGNDFITFFVTF